MKKKEFLDKLRSRLSILNDEEVEDILNEYEAHLNEKIAAGKTEEEATADFGDFNELVKEILGAYKIKDKASHESRSMGEFEAWIHKAITEITEFMKPLLDRVTTLEGDQIGYFIAYLLLTLIMVWLVQIPFWIINGLGVFLLQVIPFVGSAIGAIFSVVIKLAQLVVSVIVLIYGFQRAIEAATLKKAVNFGITIEKDVAKKAEDKPVQDKAEPKVSQAVNVEVKPEVKSAAKPNPEPAKSGVKVEHYPPVKQNGVILPFIGNFFVLLFKCFVVLCMIPGFMIALGLFIALGILIALFIKGITFIGLFLIILGLLIAIGSILDMILMTVFRKKVSHA